MTHAFRTQTFIKFPSYEHIFLKAQVWFRTERDIIPSNWPLAVYLLPQEKMPPPFLQLLLTEIRGRKSYKMIHYALSLSVNNRSIPVLGKGKETKENPRLKTLPWVNWTNLLASQGLCQWSYHLYCCWCRVKTLSQEITTQIGQIIYCVKQSETHPNGLTGLEA